MTDCENGYGFPSPTPESRAEIGCYGKSPDDLSECWCGHHIVDGLGYCPQCVGTSAMHADQTAQREALLDVLSSLVAAVSLLKRGSKKAAASDRIFDQMIADYEGSIERGRTALKEQS